MQASRALAVLILSLIVACGSHRREIADPFIVFGKMIPQSDLADSLRALTTVTPGPFIVANAEKFLDLARDLDSLVQELTRYEPGGQRIDDYVIFKYLQSELFFLSFPSLEDSSRQSFLREYDAYYRISDDSSTVFSGEDFKARWTNFYSNAHQVLQKSFEAVNRDEVDEIVVTISQALLIWVFSAKSLSDTTAFIGIKEAILHRYSVSNIAVNAQELARRTPIAVVNCSVNHTWTIAVPGSIEGGRDYSIEGVWRTK